MENAMAGEIVVGSLVQVAPGDGRPRTIVMRVIRIEGDRAWVNRFASKHGPLEVALADLKLEGPSPPFFLEFR
jgi:hypothetical protein